MSSSFELKGFLKKKSGSRNVFQERWFEYDAKTTSLRYFKGKAGASSLRGTIPLTATTTVAVVEDSGSSSSKELRFTIGTPSRTYLLLAKAPMERTMWVERLQSLLASLFPDPSKAAPSPAEEQRVVPPFKQKASSRTALTSDLFSQPDPGAQCKVTPQDEQRQRVSRELLSTEQTYVEALALLCKGFLEPLRQRRAELGLSAEELGLLFSNAELLLEFHGELLGKLHAAEERNTLSFPVESVNVGTIFVEAQPLFRAYEVYIGAHARAQETLVKVTASSPQLREFLLELKELAGKNLDLQNLLSWPIQRVPRYVLLLKELMKTTPTSQDGWHSILLALDTIERVADSINKAKTQEEHLEALTEISKRIARCAHLNLVQPHRQFLKEGILYRTWEEDQKQSTSSSFSSSSSSSSSTSSTLSQQQQQQSSNQGVPATFFLFNDLLMWAVDDVYQGFWLLDNSLALPSDTPEQFTFATKIFKAATEAHLPDQIDPSKRFRLTAASAGEASLWVEAIGGACHFLDQIPQHIRENQKKTWRNDSIQEEVRVQGFACLKTLKWKRFYCKLQGSTLYWFDSPVDVVPKSSLSCVGLQVKPLQNDAKHPFSIALSKPNSKSSPFMIQTDSLLFSIWLNQFQYASQST